MTTTTTPRPTVRHIGDPACHGCTNGVALGYDESGHAICAECVNDRGTFIVEYLPDAIVPSTRDERGSIGVGQALIVVVALIAAGLVFGFDATPYLRDAALWLIDITTDLWTRLTN